MNTKTQTLATILMVAMLWGNAVWGQGFRNVGYAGANFLKIPVEPVGAALGNAIVARADGVLGLYWNPGAIAQSEKTEILASTVDWIADTRVSFLGVIHPLPFGTLGISATALTMKEMEITTEYLPGGTGQFFGAGSYAFGLSYSTRIIDRFSFGITAKYIYEYIWETHGSTFAFDLGSVYITDFQNLRIGMRIANFGGGGRFIRRLLPERSAAGPRVGKILFAAVVHRRRFHRSVPDGRAPADYHGCGERPQRQRHSGGCRWRVRL